ncbi:LemA family protein [Nitrincola tapanii]|uniref:LemA family protein n=1 Tax=Nitrincola tapanii TaxID=1708751 RepID=A0A5A9W1Z6_9GAMM|nr:LemA family protein [Nitrincola tapanii]KAA0874128.1 LemA family protein [Nitrincola tapanii]
MDPIWIVLLILLAIALLYGVFVYNQLVQLKHNLKQSWSNIDVLLKQRHDELPKLVDTCKEHMAFEQSTLEKVMQARAQVASAREAGNIPALGQAETQLRLGLGNLFAVAEAYPELRASDSFQHLQTRITALESSIADRREYYNASVNLYNIRVEQFPDMLIARQFGFRPEALLMLSEAELQDHSVRQLFS